MNRLSKVVCSFASLAALGGTALAQEPAPTEEETTEVAPPEGEAMPPPEGETAPPVEAAPGAVPPLTLGAGKILIAGSTLNINMSADSVGEPISLAPSVYYGVNEKLTVGLIHDSGTTMWTPRPAIRTITIVEPITGTTITGAAGAGICLTGEEGGCGEVYDNVGVDALFGLSNDKMSLAVHGGLDVLSFDPFALGLRAGVLGRFMASDKLAIVFDPRLTIGVTERDAGNKEVIDVPVWVWFMASPKLGVYAHTGINGPLDGFGDAFAIPVGLGANFMLNEKMTLGGDFHFGNLAGKNSSADGRILGARFAYAL